MKVFASHNPDLQTRMKSSSGGIFSILAGWTIDRGGVVYGAASDTDKSVKSAFLKISGP